MLQFRDLNLVWTPHISTGSYTSATCTCRDIQKELTLVSLLLQRAYVMFLRQ